MEIECILNYIGESEPKAVLPSTLRFLKSFFYLLSL